MKYKIDDKCYLDYFYDNNKTNNRLIGIFLIFIVVLSSCLYAKIGEITTAIDPNTITVKSTVTYSYETKLPDGSVKQISSSTLMTAKQIQAQAAALYDAEQVKLKEIETKAEALNYKGTIVSAKTWILYGKIISYDYRYKLPDGTSNEVNSKVPLKEVEVLAKVKAVYKNQLTEELGKGI